MGSAWERSRTIAKTVYKPNTCTRMYGMHTASMSNESVTARHRSQRRRYRLVPESFKNVNNIPSINQNQKFAVTFFSCLEDTGTLSSHCAAVSLASFASCHASRSSSSARARRA